MKFILKNNIAQFAWRGLALCVLILVFGACSVTRNLEEGEILYTGAKVEVKAPEQERKVEIKPLLSELENVVSRPRPNREIFWLKWRLWLHQNFQTKKQSGIKHWLSQEVGEAPVLYKKQITEQTIEVLEQTAANHGFYQARATAEPQIKNKKAEIHYTVHTRAPYRIDTVRFPPPDSGGIYAHIAKFRSGTILKKGNKYNLSELRTERLRITQALKENGYFYFDDADLLFLADTTVGDRHINLRLTIKDDVPGYKLLPYRIGDVEVTLRMPGGREGKRDSFVFSDDRFTILHEGFLVEPGAIKDAVLLRRDKLYQPKDERSTVEQLQHLGLFKFIKINLERAEHRDSILNVSITLTPLLGHTVELQGGGFVKSNNYAGPRLAVNWLMRRPFEEALQWRIGSATSYQRAISQGDEVVSGDIWEVEFFTNLNYPEFAIPFYRLNMPPEQVANTILELKFGRQSVSLPLTDTVSQSLFGESGLDPRLAFYDFNFTYKFNWRNKRYLTHNFQPARLRYHFVNYLEPELDAKFQQLLLEVDDRTLTTALSDYVQYEIKYGIAFDSRQRRIRRDMYFFNASLGLNFNRALRRDFTLVDLNPLNAQFVALETEFRYYMRQSPKAMLAARWVTNLALPFRSDFSIPIQNLYSTGGSNSIRAFRWRGIGPGSFTPVQEQIPLLQFLANGNIKLEANLEYRYKITNLIELATFLDAGNVWLLHEESSRPGGEFRWDRLPGEIGLGTGLGLRFDISVLVLRFDYGVALLRPDLPVGQRWLPQNGFENFRFDRDTFLSFNLGYPF